MVQDSDTYRIWLESAGPGHVADPGTAAEVQRDQDETPESSAALAVLFVRAESAAERRKIYGQRALHFVPFNQISWSG